MKSDGRLSAVLHLLLHLAQRQAPMTSEVLARSIDTNPVVIRRLLGGLRDAGFVQSEKGHGGGWTLSCDLDVVTLKDVYDAIGQPAVLALGHRDEASGCLVEQAVNAALESTFQDAEALLLARLGDITLAALLEDVRARHVARWRPAERTAMRRPALLSVTALIGACSTPSSTTPHAHGHGAQHGHAHGHHAFTDAERWTKTFDDPARDAWQQPDEVLRAMALTPTMTVADVGAGTGYFSVRLARAVPQGRVIATDIEPEMVAFVAERARKDGLDNLRATAATTTSSGLAAGSVDRILIVHVWHHIDDRAGYARDLAAALRPGGRVFIVDFDQTGTRGPPPSMRLAPEQVIAELAASGLVASVSSVTPEGQYIVEARRP